MRPKYLQSLIILIILLLSFVVICVMLLHNIKSWIGWVFIIFFVLFLLIFFIDSFFEIFKGQTLDQINKYKNSLDYFDENLIIDYPYLQIKEKIKWNTIEAIFLSNKPPGDGEYHNFEYSIILNSEPKEVKYETQNWFNKINIFPKIKKKGLPIIRINDDSNLDFHTFYEAINKYLKNVNNDTENYLNLKFGNEIQFIKSGNSTKARINKPTKTLGFYKIYDKGNNLNDENLKKFREETNK